MRKTYGSLKYVHGQKVWEIRDLEPHVSLRLKQLFVRVPKNSMGPFTMADNDDVAADLVWFMERYPLSISKSDSVLLKSRSRAFYKKQSDVERIFLPSWAPSDRLGLKDGQAFTKYQLQALDVIEKVRKLVIVDDLGLGKTYEGLGVGLLPEALPMVVVVEPNLADQWWEKAGEFINLSVHRVNGLTPYSLPAADIYIFRYNQLSPWLEVLCQGWVRSIVFDEIQQLRRGSESDKGVAAAQITSLVPIVVGLTATPIYNFGIEAFNVVEIVRQGALGTRAEFLREWCIDHNGVVKDPDALGAYLQETKIFLRRTKEDVGQKSKLMKPYVHWVEPSESAVLEAESLAEKLAITTLSGDFLRSGQAAREFDMRLREMTGIAKAKAVAAFVRMVVETGNPVILAGWHREVYRIWLQELSDLNPLMYTGSESESKKRRAKSDFIQGKSDLLIISLRSGAGLDGFQKRCSMVAIGEFDWSPKVHEQLFGRVDRTGQVAESVSAIYLATNYGSDPFIIDLLGLKSSQEHGIVNPGVEKVVYQSDGDRIKGLARAYLASRGRQVSYEAAEVKCIEKQVALL